MKNKAHPALSVRTSHKRKQSVQDVADSDGSDVAVQRGIDDDHDTVLLATSTKKLNLSPGAKGPTSKKRKTDIPKTKSLRIGKRINEPPTAPLDVFVFGEGSGGELGLGSKTVDNQAPIEVLRPRLNKLLSSPKNIGVVQVACGGMHAIALKENNTIITWGVNDLGALGRETNVPEGEDDDLNPAESTPGPVDTSELDPNIRWAQVAASDNASFALTEDGRVYGWGTFRSGKGIMGFSSCTLIQKTPILIPDLKNIRQLATGNNHVLALDAKGKIFAWGCGEQSQLARKTFANHPEIALRPSGVGALPVRGAKAARVACGSYHSFAIDTEGRVYAWGLNSFAELAISDQAGEDGASQLKPRLVENLRHYKIVDIAGGEHHSLACTEDGKLLTWGRIDGYQVGLPTEAFTTENTMFDAHGKPRILEVPAAIPDIRAVTSVAAGTDHSFALTAEGKAYSWGFSANGRTGLGTEDDIEIPTLINGRAVRGKKLTFAGAGGPFSILACQADAAIPSTSMLSFAT